MVFTQPHKNPDCVLLRERFSRLTKAESKTLAVYAGMSGEVMMTSDHLGDLSPHRLHLWHLILPEERVSCDFHLLGQSEISYERLPTDTESDRVHHVPRTEDPVLVQVRRPSREGTPGAIFFVNTSNHTVQCTCPLADLVMKGPVYLYDGENQLSSEEAIELIAVTLPRLRQMRGLNLFTTCQICNRAC